jgi:hypothetical protein
MTSLHRSIASRLAIALQCRRLNELDVQTLEILQLGDLEGGLVVAYMAAL